MKTKTSAFYIAFCLSLMIGGAVSLQAWTAPSSIAPGGNVEAPLNVGTTTQTKAGGIVTSGFRSLLDAFFDGPVTVGTASLPAALNVNGDICLNGRCLENWPVNTSVSCPPGEFLTGIDGAGDALCQDPTIESEYYFGGMYGSSGKNNPLAGNTRSCPAGYAPYKVFGTTNLDYPVYVCIGLSSNVTKIAEFGGMYGYPASDFTNPLASNQRACPSGHTAVEVLGTTNVDYQLRWCYSSNLSDKVQDKFYGVYGLSGDSTYTNPVTGANYCDSVSGVKTKTVLGTYNVDYNFNFCWK
jgi:hypothetical protein